MLTKNQHYFTRAIIITVILITQLYFVWNLYSDPKQAKSLGNILGNHGLYSHLALLLTYLLSAHLIHNRARSLILILVVTAVFLRIHNADLGLYLSLLYIELLAALGFILLNSTGKSSNFKNYPVMYFTGALAWFSLVAIASILGIASITNLALFAILAGPLILIITRKHSLTAKLTEAYLKIDCSVIYWGLTLTWLIVTIATKSPYVSDHDSMMYGYRSSQILLPGNSIFENLGLMQIVYYYPKLYEITALPLSSLNEHSIMNSFGAAQVIILLVISYTLLNFLEIKKHASIITLCLICTIPAIGNIAVTAKPDILNAAAIILAIISIVKFSSRPNLNDFSLICLAGTVAITTKLTALPYLFPTTLAAFVLVIYFYFQPDNTKTHHNHQTSTRTNTVIMIICSITLFATAYRNISLTGVPYLIPGSDLFNYLGFNYHHPFELVSTTGAAAVTGYQDALLLLKQILFKPYELKQINALWPGNIAFTCIIAAITILIYTKRPQTNTKKINGILLITIAVVSVSFFMMLFLMKNRGGDGNYYIVPIILSICVSIAYIYHAGQHRLTSLALLLPIHFLVMFYSHPGGHKGTSSNILDLTKTPFTSTQKNWNNSNLKA